MELAHYPIWIFLAVLALFGSLWTGPFDKKFGRKSPQGFMSGVQTVGVFFWGAFVILTFNYVLWTFSN